MLNDLPLFSYANSGAAGVMDRVTMGLMEYAQRRVRCAWHGVTVQRHRDHVRATAARLRFENEMKMGPQ